MTYLYAVAKATGWAREFIMEDLEMAEGMGIWLCARIMNGEKFVWDDGVQIDGDPSQLRLERALAMVNPRRKR